MFTKIRLKALSSVRAKLLFGFLAMSMLVAGLGIYAFISISSTGRVVKETYDKPLMAINYARAADQVFSQINYDVLALKTVNTRDSAVTTATIFEKLEEFKQNLDVVRDRSLAKKADPFLADINTLTQDWADTFTGYENLQSVETNEALNIIATKISEKLDIVIELQTNESFRSRERAIAGIDKVERYSILASLGALVFAILISLWLAVTIIRPLKAAASAAEKISGGDFDAKIPSGGDDETGVLLNTMTIMQGNIRERMEQERDLRDLAQDRLVESLENSQDAVLLSDSEGLIIVANHKLKSTFPDLEGLNLVGEYYTQFFTPEGAPRYVDAVHYPEWSELQFMDGRWARISFSKTQEGGRLIIWTDITREKEREDNLRIARDTAEAASEAKSVFLASMSHELRTPLNAVIGFADIIEAEQLGEVENKKYVKMAGLISRSGSHLLQIVQDVLHIANGDVQTKNDRPQETLDLVEVIDFCVATIGEDAKGKNIGVIWNAPSTAHLTQGARTRLQQVFLNVLTNAVKFTPQNGFVKINVFESKNKGFQIDIFDTGLGIAPEDIHRIVEPFVQVDAGTTRAEDGVGLGLSIVKKWLDHHDGALTIQSKLNEGTCVSISLPKYVSENTDDNIPTDHSISSVENITPQIKKAI